MAQKVTLYNLLISCPGDVKDEVAIIESAVEEFNELYAEPLGITIKTRHWGKSSYAQSGGKPQALLNEQFVNKCDAAVAIMWTKFGSPTDDYGSGTEEEIEIMLQSGKQVFMYFSDKPLPPSKMNEDGYKQIQAFREKYKDRGIYFTYSSDEEFKKLFFAHLSMYFLSHKKEKESTDDRVSELKLMGIDANQKLTENLPVIDFVLNSAWSMNRYKDTIADMYQTIAGLHVGKRAPREIIGTSIAPVISFYNAEEIDKDERELLCLAAKKLELSLPDDFFDLGNLERTTMPSFAFNGPSLKGTDEEKEKYRLIKKLHKTISEMLDWMPVEKAFSGKKCCKLAIQNSGKAVDEDVEITITLPQHTLVTLKEFPKFSNREMGYLLNDCEMSILFGIDSTAEYLEYASSEQKHTTHYRPMPYGLPGYVPNYNDDFLRELRDIFCYSIYPDNDKFAIKLNVDYIKHNTTVAFPSIIFVKDMPNEVEYTITSKNNPDVVRGKLTVIL